MAAGIKSKEPRPSRGRRAAGTKNLDSDRPRNRGSSPFTEALRAVARFLGTTRRPGALIGGVAVAAHGFARFTADIDVAIVAEPEHIDELVAAARKVGLTPRIADAPRFARENLVLLLQHTTSKVPIDLSLALQPFEHEAAKRAERKKVGGVAIKVMPLDALFVYKLIAGRPRDLDDVRALLCVGTDFDARYVERTLAEFDEILETDRAQEFRALLRDRVARQRTAGRAALEKKRTPRA